MPTRDVEIAQENPLKIVGTYCKHERVFERARSEEYRLLFVFTSTIALLAFGLLPIWDTIRIIRNPGFVWMIGYRLPVAFLTITILIEVATISFLRFFLYNAPSQKQKPLQFMMVLWSILIIFGLTFILFGNGLTARSEVASNELRYNCEFGTQTESLRKQASALFFMRTVPICSNKYSVDMCSGFTETTSSDTLQYLETHYGCSNFCNTHFNETVPALFNPIPAKGLPRCHHMLARSIKNVVQGIGIRCHAIGCVLILASVVTSALSIVDKGIAKMEIAEFGN